MESQRLAIICNLIAAVAGAFGQWAYKKGGLQLGQVPIYKNGMLIAGMALFCVVMLLFVLGYKWGGKISVVYPFYATTFFWGALISFYLEKEPFRWSLVTGPVFIFIGLIVIAKDIQG
jgi:drug/metabolite transporter (DMT)-like permease